MLYYVNGYDINKLKMATYNHLPTEITANIFTYLRHERRQPCHCLAIKGMVREIDDNIIMGDYEGKVRVPYEVYEALGKFIDFEAAIMEEYPEYKMSPFAPSDRKWYNWWKDEYYWRLIALWYINIVSARLNEKDYQRILDAYSDEDGPDDYLAVDLSAEISEWVLK
jgi:hypothetical protein